MTPGSLEQRHGGKRRKTDRLDAAQLLRKRRAYLGGDRRVFSVVQVPSEAIEALRRWDGLALPAPLFGELVREAERLGQVEAQLAALEVQLDGLICESEAAPFAVMRALLRLKGLGATSASILTLEVFAWRRFANRREVAACAGLTPTPYDSGASRREQGIDKHGNRRVRALLIELAWRWSRWQPDSAESRWFRERFAGGGKRQRRMRHGVIGAVRHGQRSSRAPGDPTRTPPRLLRVLRAAAMARAWGATDVDVDGVRGWT